MCIDSEFLIYKYPIINNYKLHHNYFLETLNVHAILFHNNK